MMLRPYEIKPKNIWPAKRRPEDKSERGYYWKQFEKAWDIYCSGDEAPKKSGKVVSLMIGS